MEEATRRRTSSSPSTHSFGIGEARFSLAPSPVLDNSQLATCLSGANGPCTVVYRDTYESNNFVKDWLRIDDVYCSGFLSSILLIDDVDGNHGHSRLPAGARLLLLRLHRLDPHPPEGPCYILENKLYPVYRLYSDRLDAFCVAVQPQEDRNSGFSSNTHHDELNRHIIAVPSKIPPSRDKTDLLRGLRVAVKDNIDLEGVRTSLSSEAWQELHGPAGRTSPLVKKLVDLGMVVIGKTKLSQFGVLEAPFEWSESHCPWNPRADGALSPGGSTAGGAAAVAGYDFTDLSLGSDAAGSVRNPAAKNGVFAIRFTHEALPMAGISQLSPPLDAPGLLSRDLSMISRVVDALYLRSSISTLQPRKIFSASDFHFDATNVYKNSSATYIYKTFIDDFAQHLSAEKCVTKLHHSFRSSQALCSVNNPEVPTPRQTIDTIKRHDTHARLAPLIQQYKTVKGRAPNVNSVIREMMKIGGQISEKMYENALHQKKAFRDWFLPFLGDDLLIVPISSEDPEYRDEYATATGPSAVPARSTPLSKSYISTLAGCPELVVPIGQFPFSSERSGCIEYLPIVVGIISRPESDGSLVRSVRDFLDKCPDRSTKVMTGRMCFDPDGPQTASEVIAPVAAHDLELQESDVDDSAIIDRTRTLTPPPPPEDEEASEFPPTSFPQLVENAEAHPPSTTLTPPEPVDERPSSAPGLMFAHLFDTSPGDRSSGHDSFESIGPGVHSQPNDLNEVNNNSYEHMAFSFGWDLMQGFDEFLG